MKFDLREPNLIYGIFLSGCALPLWIAFLVLNIENGPADVTLIVALLGSFFLLAGILLIWQNNQKAKDLEDSLILPSNTAVQTVFQITIVINAILMAIGNILML